MAPSPLETVVPAPHSDPAVSVLVVNWNGRHFLGDCLSSLRRQTFRNFEIILIDNGSTDGSADWIRANYPEIRLLALPSNLGFVAANAAGMQSARARDWVVLLNNDTETDAHWLQALMEAAAAHPQAGSLACKMLYFDQRERIDNCGFVLTSSGASRDIGRDRLDGPAFAREFWVFGGCGGAVAYSRKMLDDVGFFDPDIFMTYEDFDLAFRAQLCGWPCLFVPLARVYHHCHGTVPARSGRQVLYSQRNIELVFVKNMPAALMMRFCFHRLLYEVGAAIYFARIGFLPAFLRAKVVAMLRLPVWLARRRQIQARRRITPAQLCSLMEQKGWIIPRLRKIMGWPVASA